MPFIVWAFPPEGIDSKGDPVSSENMNPSIVQADLSQLDTLALLFDAYRQFYTQRTDIAAAREFLRQRLEHGDSTILLAIDGAEGVGFTQLYPSFSSVSMRRLWILNDLFVDPSVRRSGVGRRLLEAAIEYASSTSAVRLVLATGVENHEAQALYVKDGWQLDTEFLHYSFPLNGG